MDFYAGIFHMVAVAKKKPLFATMLREFRKAADLTQAQTAERVGVHIQTYMRWERGDAEPGYSRLVELARVLGKTLNDFAPAEGEAEG